MGRLTRDTATGSMSPYIKVIVGTRQERTNVHADAGKYPQWENEFSFNIVNEDIVSFIACDRNHVSSDSVIGEGHVAIASIVAAGCITEWYEIKYKGKNAGQVQFTFAYTEDPEVVAKAQAEEAKNQAEEAKNQAEEAKNQVDAQPLQQPPSIPQQPMGQPPGVPPEVAPPGGHQQHMGPPPGYPPQQFPPYQYPPQQYPPQQYPPQQYPPQQPYYPPQGPPKQQFPPAPVPVPVEQPSMMPIYNPNLSEEEQIKEAFCRIDTDGSGSIDKKELRNALKSCNEALSYDIIDEIIRDVDQDGDGKIDIGEFVSLVSITKCKN